MSLMFSLRVHFMQEYGIDPDTGKAPEGKWKDLLIMMREAKQDMEKKKDKNEKEKEEKEYKEYLDSPLDPRD